MKNILAILVLSFFLFSCDEEKKVIYYEYDNVVVTRIDVGTESRFYYGKFSLENTLPNSYVKSIFSGFNNGMHAFMMFAEKRVEICYSMDYFVNVGNDSSVLVVDHLTGYPSTAAFYDSVANRYGNICFINNVVDLEIAHNKKNHSLVKATYE